VTEDFFPFARAIELVTRVQKLAVVVLRSAGPAPDGQTVFPKSRTSSSAFFFSERFRLTARGAIRLVQELYFDFAMCIFTPSQAAETIARFVVGLFILTKEG